MRSRKNMKLQLLLLLATAFVIFTGLVYTYGRGDTLVTLDERASEGQLIYQEKNCQACHQIYGLGGHMGPDLTKVISEKGKDHTAAFIRYGTRRMPTLGLDSNDASLIIAYLEHVGRTAAITGKTDQKILTADHNE